MEPHFADESRASQSDAPTRPLITNRLSAQLSPPYWQYQRSIPAATHVSLDGSPGITLEDHEIASPMSPSQSALWAKSISIDDYVIIRGNPTGLGDYVVWNCQVETLDGGPMVIRKRYSEFTDLRYELTKRFPNSTRNSLPLLPPKSAIYKFRPQFLEKRRQGLIYFLTCVMLNPEYASSDAVKDFIFGDQKQ